MSTTEKTISLIFHSEYIKKIPVDVLEIFKVLEYLSIYVKYRLRYKKLVKPTLRDNEQSFEHNGISMAISTKEELFDLQFVARIEYVPNKSKGAEQWIETYLL